MEDGGNQANEVQSYEADVAGSFIHPADSTSKLSPNDLSPDRTSEIDNSLSKTEPMEVYLSSNKVNGDCSVECSVPSPSSLPPNNNNTSSYKISTERNPSFLENSSCENVDVNASYDCQKKEVKSSEVDIASLEREEKECLRNLSFPSQQKFDHSHQNENKRIEQKLDRDDLSTEKNKTLSNTDEVSSILEEKSTCDVNDMTSTFETEFKPTVSKTRKFSPDNPSILISKNCDTFKAPPRYDLKSKVKPYESIGESGQKYSDTITKATDKTNRNNKRKLEDKLTNIYDEMDLNDIEKFPIQYKGFKKKISSINEKSEKRLHFRWNPFNPACKPNPKSNKCIPSRLPVGDEIDCSALQQSEYAQYLGLQPILKFRCSNCGSSAFQSMVALNTHQVECTKSGKGKMDKTPVSLSNPPSEPKSTNIKLTRKVFLCSACGTYYEHWNLFLHMREVHRRYICLYCLGMFSIAEKLSEHLIQKHKIMHQNFSNLEDFQKHCYQAFYLLCLTCDKVFCEMDEFYGHVCSTNKKSIDNGDSSSKSEAAGSQELNSVPNNETCTSIANSKTSTKRSKETGKKSTITTRSSQMKKEETISGNAIPKAVDISASSSDKEDVKPSDINVSDNVSDNVSETVKSCVSENNLSDNKASNIKESDINLPGKEQDLKSQESQITIDSTSLDKIKPVKKTKSVTKKMTVKRKKPKEKEEAIEASLSRVKKKIEEEPIKEPNCSSSNETGGLVLSEALETENVINDKEVNNFPNPSQISVEESNPEVSESCEKQEEEEEDEEEEEEKVTDLSKVDKTHSVQEELSEVAKEEFLNVSTVETKNKLQANLLKFKLPGLESDGESDDSQKLSLVVDETVNSDTDHKISAKSGENSPAVSDLPVSSVQSIKESDNQGQSLNEAPGQDITLASEDVAVMALTLDDKIESIPIQTVLKECVRTSCMSCNYCRHAVKIAVNGKQLALHILSEHRYMPIKNETPEDVINKLKTSLDNLQTMFFNTEAYDSSDPSIHVPYDQDSSFDCFQCNYVTSSHRDLFAHKRKSHTKSLLLCIMCKSNFYSYSELLCHLCPGTYNAEIQFHNVDINFRCCFCRLDNIPSAFRLMVHLRKTHHTCDICLENGVDQQKLSTHMWKHKLNHLCYRCGIAYASKPDITKHLFWKHGHESVLCKKCLQKKWPHVYHFCIPPTSFICEECNTSFSKAVALKVHKRIHGNDFPYTCAECGKKFVSKKLLQRHEERHIAIKTNVEQKQSDVRQEEDQKEDIINVSDVINENKESSAADLSDSKETEPKDKSHKKHKKDKDKKDKQVVDVYDLPPLNLSSESDSSDEENNVNDNSPFPVDKKQENLNAGEEKNEKPISLHPTELNDSCIQNDGSTKNEDAKGDDKNTSIKSPFQEETSITFNKEHREKKEDNGLDNNQKNPADVFDGDEVGIINDSNVIKADREDGNLENVSANVEQEVDNKEVEDIWKNFYNTNPQNSNLPYPLCAIKSEIALGIIMGDHDYCHQPIVEPPEFSAETPSTSGMSVPLINDQLEEINEPTQEKVNEVSFSKDANNASSPLNSPKKKPKSPKKKNLKGAGVENNTSSSSDSSSESSSSSCSCGPNCSCSSSSTSSSSSSSDSESSAGEEGMKQERKRKKRERRSKTKSDHEPELSKEQILPQDEKTLPLEPVDPPIRESELETDETTTDEEFYDQQPQRIANQLLAEKRNQLMLLASAANANNGNASPSPMVDVLPQEVVSAPKQKVRTKRKRKVTTKGKASSEKNVSNSHPYPNYQKDNEPVTKPVPQYQGSPLPPLEPKLSPFVVQATPVLSETPGSGSETEKSRSSKRRRIPNKFYGYSSGDEEDKPAPSPKWRKDTVHQTPKVQPPLHPPTPRIQLTVPKQVIRKPYKIQKSQPPKAQPSSSDSTDSGSEMEIQRPPQAPPVNQDTSTSATSQKNDKDVYCYCRCPYDEVSEMIACDDENCEIEWFHFECVGILVPPRGQWFCPGCRKARGLPT